MRMKVKYAKNSVLVRRRLPWTWYACEDIHTRQYKVRAAQCKGKQEPMFKRLQQRFHAGTPGPVSPMQWTGRRP